MTLGLQGGSPRTLEPTETGAPKRKRSGCELSGTRTVHSAVGECWGSADIDGAFLVCSEFEIGAASSATVLSC